MGCCECAMLVSWVLLDVIIEDGLSTGANHWGVSTEGLLLGPSTVACPLGCVYCSGVLQNEDLGCCKCVMLVSCVLLDVIIEDGPSTGAIHWGMSTVRGLFAGAIHRRLSAWCQSAGRSAWGVYRGPSTVGCLLLAGDCWWSVVLSGALGVCTN